MTVVFEWHLLTWIQATVIYPAALAVAQEVQASGEEFIAACVVGYEVGCRVGEYLGKSHYEVCNLINPEFLSSFPFFD